MATKYEHVVSAAQMQHTRPPMSDEEARGAYEQARSNMNSYMEKGEWPQTFLKLDDTRLLDKMKEITDDHRHSCVVHLNYQRFEGDKLIESMQVYERNAKRIMELQGIINKKLEEL